MIVSPRAFDVVHGDQRRILGPEFGHRRSLQSSVDAGCSRTSYGATNRHVWTSDDTPEQQRAVLMQGGFRAIDIGNTRGSCLTTSFGSLPSILTCSPTSRTRKRGAVSSAMPSRWLTVWKSIVTTVSNSSIVDRTWSRFDVQPVGQISSMEARGWI